MNRDRGATQINFRSSSFRVRMKSAAEASFLMGMKKVASGAKAVTGDVTPASLSTFNEAVSRVKTKAAPLSKSFSLGDTLATVTPKTPYGLEVFLCHASIFA